MTVTRLDISSPSGNGQWMHAGNGGYMDLWIPVRAVHASDNKKSRQHVQIDSIAGLALLKSQCCFSNTDDPFEVRVSRGPSGYPVGEMRLEALGITQKGLETLGISPRKEDAPRVYTEICEQISSDRRRIFEKMFTNFIKKPCGCALFIKIKKLYKFFKIIESLGEDSEKVASFREEGLKSLGHLGTNLSRYAGSLDNLHDAVSVAQQAIKRVGEGESFYSQVHVLCQAAQIIESIDRKAANNAIREAIKIANKVSDLAWSAVSFFMLSEALRKRCPRKADRFYRRMLEKAYHSGRKDAIFNKVSGMLYYKDRPDGMLALLNEMENPQSRDPVLWWCIKLLLKKDLEGSMQIDQATRLLPGFNNLRWKDLARVEIYKAQLQSGRKNEAETTYKAIKTSDVKDNLRVDSINRCLEENQIDNVWRIIDEMETQHRKDHAYLLVIKARLEKNQMDNALEFVDKIEEAYVRNEARMEYIKVVLEKDQIDEALLVFNEIETGLDGNRGKDEARLLFIRPLLRRNYMKLARKILFLLGGRSPLCRPWDIVRGYHEVVKVLLANGQLKEVCEASKEVETMVIDRIKGDMREAEITKEVCAFYVDIPSSGMSVLSDGRKFVLPKPKQDPKVPERWKILSL